MKKNTIRLRQSELNKIISETVNRLLKENEENREVYSVNRVTVRKVEDRYEDGEIPETEYYSDYATNETAGSVKELIEKIADSQGLNAKDAYCLDGNIRIEGLVSEDETPMSRDQIERWKQGKIKGYNYELSFSVSRVHELSHEDLVAAGIQSYD